MPRPYKGYSFQRTIQLKYTQPRHQPSDRDQEAQCHLKAKAARTQKILHNNTPELTINPPQSQNNEPYNATLQQPQDPILRDPPSLNILELDLCTAFRSVNV